MSAITDRSGQADPPGPREALTAYPPPEKWDDWVEFDPKAWPRRVARHFDIVPTVCFNCESACGLLAFVDKKDGRIDKFTGNPYHPGSRGRNCAKGPATINQVNDPERILYPLKRAGRRGEGKWERTTWDEALDTFAVKIRAAIVEDRKSEVVYHVGRPGHDGYMDRVLQAWGIDGHNSHTNICSAAARLGYALWSGIDRPSPDYTNARFILLISAHLESGHYFNPHAQRIIEAQQKGAKIAVLDVRLSNTASMCDYWLPTYPGSEAAVVLAIAKILIDEGRFDREFVRKWVNWEEYLREERPDLDPTFDTFVQALKEIYAEFTPELASAESGIPVETIRQIAREVAAAGPALSTHVWRSAASGNLGGWQIARALFFLNVLTGSVGEPGGTSPNAWDKFVAAPFLKPPPQNHWNELHWPREFPLAHHEMSFLLPYFLREGRGKLAAYFTRVYNPVWTNPDGTGWIEALSDESKVELHAALTPTWSETAWYADYVLPMGVASERHDIMSQETHAGRWIAFRQPVHRVLQERAGEQVDFTYQVNPGEVWEEDEFWIELSWRIDPDGSLGIRRYFESPYRPGEKLTVTEYYRWIFENSVPGLPVAAAKEGLTPLDYMRKYGCFEVASEVYRVHEQPVPGDPAALEAQPDGLVKGPDGSVLGVAVDGQARSGFPTPTRRLEFFSKTLKDWGWPEYALPGYIRSHVHPANLAPGEMALVPTFRLPTLIHTRSGNAKWLNEISHSNPVWINPDDARRIGVQTGDLIRVNTEIGFFVNRAWVTECMRPGVVACSHHLGRWRQADNVGTDRWVSAKVALTRDDQGIFRLRQERGVEPFKSDDPDSSRVWWTDAGVHQNLTFAPHPDPVSGMHCWHQAVRVEPAHPEDRYGDIQVDTKKGQEIYREWLAETRPAPGPGGLRRPLWFLRPIKPAPEAYRIE